MRSQIIPWTAVLLSKSSWRHRRHFWKAGRWSKRSKQLWFSSWNLPWPLQKPRHLNTYRRTCIHEFMHAYITCIHLYLYSQIYGCYISKTSIPFRKTYDNPFCIQINSMFLPSEVYISGVRGISTTQISAASSQRIEVTCDADACGAKVWTDDLSIPGLSKGRFLYLHISTPIAATPIAGCFLSWIFLGTSENHMDDMDDDWYF